MMRRFHFFLCSLPALPELGGAPPVELARFREWAVEEPSLLPVVDAVLLEQDLLWREAATAGQAARPAPLVLSEGQVSGREPLPTSLTPPEAAPARRFPSDATWAAYWKHVASAGARHACPFVRRWAGFEVALRNALARARARSLGLDPREFLVSEELGDEGDPAEDEPLEDIVKAWSEAPDPLAGLRILDEARLRWTRRHSRYFSFAKDEAAAYARHLLLAHRWRRIGTG